MSTNVLFAGFLQSMGIAAIAALVYDITLRHCASMRLQQFLTALVFAAGAVGSMMQPMELAPGLIFDMRNSFVILAMSYGGWLAVGATSAAAMAYRLWVGGAGALAGVIGIGMCACAGIVFALFFRRNRISTLTFAVLGLCTGASLVSVFVLPLETALMIIEKIGVSMIIANVLGAVLVGEILERRRSQYHREHMLSREASTDALTSLANRRAFDARGPDILSEATRKGLACCVMIVDIDRFKQINDRHGHDVGDRVLQHLAELVRANVRQSDLVARFGGEEIALVLPAHDAERAFNLAERLRHAVEATPFQAWDGPTIRLSVSVGLYANEGRPESFASAFKRADLALYRAKSAGRNRVEIALAA